MEVGGRNEVGDGEGKNWRLDAPVAPHSLWGYALEPQPLRPQKRGDKEMSKGCRTCRLATDLLVASYTLKDAELSDAVLKFIVKHAAEANHKLEDGWTLVK